MNITLGVSFTYWRPRRPSARSSKLGDILSRPLERTKYKQADLNRNRCKRSVILIHFKLHEILAYQVSVYLSRTKKDQVQTISEIQAKSEIHIQKKMHEKF